MTIVNLAQPPTGGDFRSIFARTAAETGFLLTANDRSGVERMLRHRGTKHAPNPALLNGLLRHKLRISQPAPEPVPPTLVVAGCHVTYMISGEGARSGTLVMSSVPVPGRLLVATLLGATLLGMRKMQKVPLLRDTGEIDTLVVLDVAPPPEFDAA
ncbi:hypothetical protein OG2516_13169 [Oceanicola granulosus HTCC2516]|uniref:Transcription elongation factor GreA/GreB C-terminal domain-containing protein n=1 Tax=Oceanicola granulosus (strain ATCC BAA-861 / DSM 15982 / KCTC 12143 / HTCC2516) TaxID=314256 RepID=Q2CH34_OCEGH|nr:hypothetical protein [Oceanicola granulosus]EAR51977.1 hypothetical protein OG2516_13169 [Oceanicola granulosus HTCC2516]